MARICVRPCCFKIRGRLIYIFIKSRVDFHVSIEIIDPELVWYDYFEIAHSMLV